MCIRLLFVALLVSVSISVCVSQVDIVVRMAVFSLEEFVANPTLEQLGVSKKTDLFTIAKHYVFLCLAPWLKRSCKQL